MLVKECGSHFVIFKYGPKNAHEIQFGKSTPGLFLSVVLYRFLFHTKMKHIIKKDLLYVDRKKWQKDLSYDFSLSILISYINLYDYLSMKERMK